jgi:hypothetical protein
MALLYFVKSLYLVRIYLPLPFYVPIMLAVPAGLSASIVRFSRGAARKRAR